MASNQPVQTVTWSVVGINPQVDVTGGGIPVKGNMVTFVTASGHRGNVFVPDSVPNHDAARDIIAARAAFIEGLGKLSG